MQAKALYTKIQRYAECAYELGALKEKIICMDLDPNALYVAEKIKSLRNDLETEDNVIRNFLSTKDANILLNSKRAKPLQ